MLHIYIYIYDISTLRVKHVYVIFKVFYLPTDARVNCLKNNSKIYIKIEGQVAQSVQRQATTGWTVRGSNPGGGEIFRTCPERPCDPPFLLYNEYRVFPGGKEKPGRDADPSPTSSAVGHERVELYLYSPHGPYGLYRASVRVQGWPLPLPFTLKLTLKQLRHVSAQSHHHRFTGAC